ncbi:MAG: hypothetical protein KA797_03610 [Chitinophagales bacterium]|nr:hypothetical protein [Chitinophagales bacterium]
MNTKKFLALGILSIGLLSIQMSCSKAVDLTSDTEIAEDNVLAEQIDDDVENIASQSDVNEKLEDLKTADAGSILSDSIKIEKDLSKGSIKIDFGGDNGCKGKNGRLYKGKIFKSFNGKKYFDEGYSSTVTFEKFSNNGNSVEGTKTIVYKGLNAKGQMYWTISTSLTITKANGKSMTWTSTRTRTMIAGAGTKTWGDDKYELTGSASGTSSNGNSYETTITTPLIKDMACKYIVSGVINYVKTGTTTTKTKTLDFGNGDCDAKAVLTVDGTSKDILL